MRTIETERLILRDFIEADWDAVNAMLSDGEANRHMHFAKWTVEQRQEWFAWWLTNNQEDTPDTYIWAIVLKATGETIGYLGIGSASHPSG